MRPVYLLLVEETVDVAINEPASLGTAFAMNGGLTLGLSMGWRV